ncbi:hypothetical protein CERZMDRAFT_105790 [Cercospora zeae-maydis SCOH1-5]|uniref:Transcription factor domain-containing protein n=1 Tax=Cercospora zeae-maydis SCOH1-5 TaxID=717836 RepID=A0A6A6FJZ2_9PEZI|nr:hypothetical protein CERZMDRAFT_105790 [Cercospora zeae-maydis SCOH1-5]
MADKNSANLQFVTVEQPSDIKKAGYRRKVRSHVAKTQHRRAREANSTTTAFRFVQGTDGRKTKHRLGKPKRIEVEEYDTEQLSPQDAARQEICRRAAVDALHTNGPGALFASGAMYLRTMALDDADNDVGMVLNSIRCDVSTVWTLYEHYTTSQTQAFLGDNPEMRDRDHAACLLSFLWQDSTLLNVAMLSGTRKLLDSRGHALHTSEAYQLSQLRGRIIRRLNVAMADPVRRISDEVITAVLFFALYELRYTSTDAYNAHMTGLVLLINLRGGIAELRRSVSYIANMVVWCDQMGSRISGREPHAKKMLDCSTSDPSLRRTASPDAGRDP